MIARNRILAALIAIGTGFGICPTATHAGSHLWRFNEIFSSEDGAVQFIELRECCGAEEEVRLLNKWIESAATGVRFTFPEDIECCTSRRHLLLANAAFAELPGAPPPDYVLPDDFFDLHADTLSYWRYNKAIFPFEEGQLPLDGLRSLAGDYTTAVNTPTNYASETGSIVVSCHPADLDADGEVSFTDLVKLLASWGACDYCPADMDRSGLVDFADLLELLNGWGPCA